MPRSDALIRRYWAIINAMPKDANAPPPFLVKPPRPKLSNVYEEERLQLVSQPKQMLDAGSAAPCAPRRGATVKKDKILHLSLSRQNLGNLNYSSSVKVASSTSLALSNEVNDQLKPPNYLN